MKNQAYFEDVLKARQKELQLRLNKIESDLEQLPDQDSEERASEREDDEVLESMGQAGISELRAIDAAIDRIAMGTFGICVRCGEEISQERLKSVPHAALCQNCIRRS